MNSDNLDRTLSLVLEDWAKKKIDFVHGLPPATALDLSGVKTLELLSVRLGKNQLTACLDAEKIVDSPLKHASPTAGKSSTEWLKRSKMVGINVRTIGSFWQIMKYQLCLPAHIQAIHLLPIWEPGVVSSLYGMASWHINEAFFSSELAILRPELDTVEKQLRVVVNLLHALGRVVGMDVIPHTDRYSEMVLANPAYFEWLRRDELRIAEHGSNLYRRVEEAILTWLQFVGTADGSSVPMDAEAYFRGTGEAARLRALFGDQDRRTRRIRLMDHLYRLGLEPVPATMAPPYRGLEVDPDPVALTVDDAGRVWRDYRITKPTEMSRVFGPLARYQLYERLEDNRHWQIDFARPRPHVWSYVAEQYAHTQASFGFDFMRGDMSHVQMRPEGPADEPHEYYDLLGYVKTYIQQEVPYFAYFAESFLTPDDYMGYGNEVKHLVASQAEVTLGNLQSMVPGSEEFMSELASYRTIAAKSPVKPCFTVITGDKDDPRFDKFYVHGLAARMFTALLLADWPAYYSLGVEQRDVKYQPWSNEYYTKLYVFHLEQGPKSTQGPYRWGGNMELFGKLNRLHRFVASVWSEIEGQETNWLIPPDPERGFGLLLWLIGERYLCAVNFGEKPAGYRGTIAKWTGSWELRFSLTTHTLPNLVAVEEDGIIPLVEAGDGIVWERS